MAYLKVNDSNYDKCRLEIEQRNADESTNKKERDVEQQPLARQDSYVRAVLLRPEITMSTDWGQVSNNQEKKVEKERRHPEKSAKHPQFTTHNS